ncbi:hypothetical protein ACLOJK_004246 [Asimina triloba]
MDRDLVTSIREHWFCARCVNTSKPAGEGIIIIQITSFLLVAMYDGSIGSASRAMAAVDQFVVLHHTLMRWQGRSVCMEQLITKIFDIGARDQLLRFSEDYPPPFVKSLAHTSFQRYTVPVFLANLDTVDCLYFHSHLYRSHLEGIQELRYPELKRDSHTDLQHELIEANYLRPMVPEGLSLL